LAVLKIQFNNSKTTDSRHRENQQIAKCHDDAEQVTQGDQPLAILDFYKKLSYCRGTARCVVSIEILTIAMQQCRNYLYDKS